MTARAVKTSDFKKKGDDGDDPNFVTVEREEKPAEQKTTEQTKTKQPKDNSGNRGRTAVVVVILLAVAGIGSGLVWKWLSNKKQKPIKKLTRN